MVDIPQILLSGCKSHSPFYQPCGMISLLIGPTNLLKKNRHSMAPSPWLTHMPSPPQNLIRFWINFLECLPLIRFEPIYFLWGVRWTIRLICTPSLTKTPSLALTSPGMILLVLRLMVITQNPPSCMPHVVTDRLHTFGSLSYEGYSLLKFGWFL